MSSTQQIEFAWGNCTRNPTACICDGVRHWCGFVVSKCLGLRSRTCPAAGRARAACASSSPGWRDGRLMIYSRDGYSRRFLLMVSPCLGRTAPGRCIRRVWATHRRMWRALGSRAIAIRRRSGFEGRLAFSQGRDASQSRSEYSQRPIGQ